MANTNINSQMFTALKVSEVSKVPFLFMSAPGMGKSTSVELYANQRGYELEILRGNSTTESEIMGYDVVDPRPNAKSTIHLRPSWFGNVMTNKENGKTTLLFVDEITTCPEHVQSALLHLIFERKVGNERIPDDTLIVSAGNYAQSLGTGFGLIPPLMNRFCIFNIIPQLSDLESFVCHHQGAALGKTKNFADEMKKLLAKIDSGSTSFGDSDLEDRATEIIENAFFDVTKMLSSDMKAGGKEAKLDLKVTDVQSIYTDVDNDDPLRGFVTMRTLNYAIKITIATWKCFGKSGINSDTYLNMLQGLVGLGLTRESKSVKLNFIANDYLVRIKGAVQEIEKLGNAAVLDYNKYFVEFIKDNLGSANSTITKEQAGVLKDKFTAIMKDPKVSNISKPVDSVCIEKLVNSIIASAKPVGAYNLKKAGSKLPTVAEITGAINIWNNYSDFFITIMNFVETKSYDYDSKTLGFIGDAKTELYDSSRKFDSIIKLIEADTDNNDSAATSLIPEIHRNYTKKAKK